MSLQNKFYDAPEPDTVVFEVVFSEKDGYQKQIDRDRKKFKEA